MANVKKAEEKSSESLLCIQLKRGFRFFYVILNSVQQEELPKDKWIKQLNIPKLWESEKNENLFYPVFNFTWHLHLKISGNWGKRN